MHTIGHGGLGGDETVASGGGWRILPHSIGPVGNSISVAAASPSSQPLLIPNPRPFPSCLFFLVEISGNVFFSVIFSFYSSKLERDFVGFYNWA